MSVTRAPKAKSTASKLYLWGTVGDDTLIGPEVAVCPTCCALVPARLLARHKATAHR